MRRTGYSGPWPIDRHAGNSYWHITADDHTGNIWLATNGQGLIAFDGKTFTVYNNANSILRSNTVTDILIDRNGDKWISTFGGLVFTNKP